MKRLTCEMCGSTDLIKDGGVFVCQVCGCKYSVEEAKKMMVEVEGTVEVKGTVQVDQTENINKYMSLARDANKGGNSAECEKYSNKVLEINPENAEAWFLKGTAIGWQSTLRNLRIKESVVAWKNAIKYSKDEMLPAMSADIVTSFDRIVIALYSLYLDRVVSSTDTSYFSSQFMPSIGNLQQFYRSKMLEYSMDVIVRKQPDLSNLFLEMKAQYIPYNIWSKKFAEQESETLEELRSNKGMSRLMPSTQGRVITAVCYHYGISTMLSDQDMMAAYDKQLQTQGNVERAARQAGFMLNKVIDEEFAKTKKEKEEDARKIQERKQKAAKQKIEEYWKVHPEEKQALDAEREQLTAERTELDTKLSELKDKRNSVPAKAELDAVKSKISALQSQQSSLSLFKGKEKKALQEQIDAQKVTEAEIQKTVDAQQAEVDTEIEPLQKRYSEIRTRIGEIDREFTKER